MAARIAYEREARDWTYEGLAKRMTDAGCPIRASAIYKTEKSDRRITVAELVALSSVFEVPLDDLLVPPALAADQRARELWQRYVAISDEFEEVGTQFWEHIDAHPASAESVREAMKSYYLGDGRFKEIDEQIWASMSRRLDEYRDAGSSEGRASDGKRRKKV